MGEKVGFTNCVFEKLCFFFWKHYFYSAFSKTQLFKSKNGMLKQKQKLWKIVGCFWTWQNGAFGVCFFWGFNVIVVCFGVFGIVPEVLKCLFFFQFFGLLWGGLFLFTLGLEGLGVFVFLVFVFVFCVAFVSVLFALFLFCCWIVFWCWFLFCFCFCFFLLVFVFLFFLFLFFLFCFFWRVKGQVRWPKGPPHLALNPLFWFLFYIFFVFCYFFFFGRV